MVMTENSQIHRFFYKSELIKSDHPYQMYDQRSHPGNHTLPYHNTNSPTGRETAYGKHAETTLHDHRIQPAFPFGDI